MKGRIQFTSSAEKWNAGFQWAKEQALAYSHENDLVGDWYEAALPKRQSFCVRDVAHHANGAYALGLCGHTKNMLLRFAQNIAESRQFCTFWEITKEYSPCAVDYTSDKDFWYNLPANFDLIDTCFRMYAMTGDQDYLLQSDFVHFYQVSLEDYVKWWDCDGDGLLERREGALRLGIPSYCEAEEFERAQALIDMLAIEISGYQAAINLYHCRGEIEKAKKYQKVLTKLESLLEEKWWDETKQKFYQVKDSDGSLKHSDEMGHSLSLCYYQVIKDLKKRNRHLDRLHKEALENPINVESLSHYPVLFYRGGQPERAMFWLEKLIDPKLQRREYPEVSYAVIESYIYHLAGITLDGIQKTIEIDPKLPEEISWFQVENLPFLNGEVDVSFSQNKLMIHNRTEVIITGNGVKIKPKESVEVWKNQ